MSLTIFTEKKDRELCNNDETFRQTKGKYIGKDFANAHGFRQGREVIQNGKKVQMVINPAEKDETPLEMPVVNFGTVEEHHKKIHTNLGQEQPLALPSMEF